MYIRQYASKPILSQSYAMICWFASPILPDPVTHCSLGYKGSAGLATPSDPQLSTWLMIIIVLTSLWPSSS